MPQPQQSRQMRIHSALSNGGGNRFMKGRCQKRLIYPLAVSLFVMIGIGLNVFVVLQQRDSTIRDPAISHWPPPLALKNHSQQQKTPIATVAHVVSLIKCTKQASVTGFLDAAAVLRHSIHQQSIHSSKNDVNSRYSYQMYAIVHESCRDNAAMLGRLGYKAIVRPSPIAWDDIQPGWYKDHVEGENCCGSAEFIKLYAYTLTEYPIVVHWDLDVALFHPMDDLFDAMIFDRQSAEGKRARSRLEVQHPHQPLPSTIDAYFTRDITSAQPWEIRQGVQGGFLIARPNVQHFEQYLKFIKAANYTGGRGNDRGWDGLGYGGFQGAMAYQGAVAYFYDQLAPNTSVELDICIWNQVVADVIWRGPPRPDLLDHCREYPVQPGVTLEENTPRNGHCRDCRILPVEQTKSAHYTACKKPWECSLPHPRKPKDPKLQYKLNELTNITTCGLLFQKWFELRQDFEDRLQDAAGVVPSHRNGRFEAMYFGGNCRGRGNYIAMNPPPDNYDIAQLYGL